MLARFLSVLLLALVVGQAFGAATLLESAECAQCCPGEGAEEEGCEPDCDLCACCPSVRCVLTPHVQLPGDAGDALSQAIEGPLGLPTADPREILHIPKALL